MKFRKKPVIVDAVRSDIEVKIETGWRMEKKKV